MHFIQRHAHKAVGTFTLGLFLIYAAILFRLREPLAAGYSDFISFYTAGKILDRGAPERLYDLDFQYRIQHEIAPRVPIRHGALPFVRPAFEAWIFWPLAHLPYLTAFVLWNLLSCASVVAALLMLRQEIPELRNFSSPLILALGLSYFPIFFTLVASLRRNPAHSVITAATGSTEAMMPPRRVSSTISTDLLYVYPTYALLPVTNSGIQLGARNSEAATSATIVPKNPQNSPRRRDHSPTHHTSSHGTSKIVS